MVRRVRLQRRAGTATLRRHLVSIGKAHVSANYDDPTKSVYVKTVWAGIRRKERGTTPRKKDDFNRERLVLTVDVNSRSSERAKRADAANDRLHALLCAYRGGAILAPMLSASDLHIDFKFDALPFVAATAPALDCYVCSATRSNLTPAWGLTSTPLTYSPAIT